MNDARRQWLMKTGALLTLGTALPRTPLSELPATQLPWV